MMFDGEGKSLVPVHVCWNDTEAEIVISVLRENGIEAQPNSEIPHSVLPLIANGIGEIRVLVAAEDAERARAALETVRLVPVYAGWNVQEAERVISLLREREIEAWGDAEMPSSIYHPFAVAERGVAVWVDPANVDGARAVLEEAGIEANADFATGDQES